VSNLFRIITGLFREERGQDLAEYCLITAFVAVGSCALYFNVSGGVHNIWNHANVTLTSSVPASTPAGSAPQPSDGSTMTLAPSAHENVPGTLERGSEKNN